MSRDSRNRDGRHRDARRPGRDKDGWKDRATERPRNGWNDRATERPRNGWEDRPTESPRDRFLTVYGRKPVLEVLADERLQPVRLVLAEGIRGEQVTRIIRAAAARGLRPDHLPAQRVSLLSGNGRQDQGVTLDLRTPTLGPLTTWLTGVPAGPVLLLDGLTNPANVGMIIRSAAAAGCAVVAPRRGVAELGPLVIKASAGVLFTATVLRHATARGAAEELVEAGFTLLGLRGGGGTPSLWTEPWPDRACLVVGGESDGVSASVADLVAGWRRIPMQGGVESLNAAVAASIACFEARRATTGPAPGREAGADPGRAR